MQITLCKFEQIDSLLTKLLHMGAFETCSDPREYIRISNRLHDACIDAMGRDWVMDQPSDEHAAANIVTMALLCQIEVIDEEAA